MIIFIGFDEREEVAFHVLSHSILSRASRPVAIVPLVRSQLRSMGFTRQRAENESTDFSISRFLVPYLSGYEGVSLFMDCDMLCLTDIYKVHVMCDGDLVSSKPAVWVCKHDYSPKTLSKFLGHVQQPYRCKNWSSFMVFNNAECKALTPEYVNTAEGLKLHQFWWLGKDGEERIGSLPLEWNHLVGEYAPNPEANILHYTLGGPWFRDGDPTPEEVLWWQEYAAMRRPLK